VKRWPPLRRSAARPSITLSISWAVLWLGYIPLHPVAKVQK
jgi:hypothetical protein